MDTAPLRTAGPAPAPASDVVQPGQCARALPRHPVLGWASFAGVRDAAVPSVAQLPHKLLVTSGRAALHAALLQLSLAPGSAVLLPTYHCPSMVAPVVRAGLTPRFYAIGDDGLPRIGQLDALCPAAALVVAHLFGLPQDLAAVREWCDRRGVPMVEDCAHSFFGMAGSRPVGCWGDFATASLTKFLPVPELGLLASSRRALHPVALAPQGARAKAKAWVDVLEVAACHGRPAGLAGAVRALMAVKNALRTAPSAHAGAPQHDDAAALMAACDLSRVDHAPLPLSAWLFRHLPLQRVVAHRQRNFDHLRAELAGLPGARVPAPQRATTHAPYVLPLWVDDAERTYPRLRALGLPVMRWDRAWPGASAAGPDTGPGWRTHLLQLPCHQDLSLRDVDRLAQQVRRCLAT